MTWFKVDDGFHSHPKAAAASLAAIGLWAVAGSWASEHLTDGDVPAHMIPSLSRGATELADELVTCGLWRRTRSGYRFHQWTTNGDGVKRNPSRKEVEEERRKKADAGRKGGLASAKTRSTKQAPARAPASRLLQPPTRPSPSTKERGSGGAPASQAARAADPRTSPLHDPPSAAGRPPDLSEVRAKLRADSAKHRAKATRRTGAFNELRAATTPPPEPPEGATA